MPIVWLTCNSISCSVKRRSRNEVPANRPETKRGGDSVRGSWDVQAPPAVLYALPLSKASIEMKRLVDRGKTLRPLELRNVFTI